MVGGVLDRSPVGSGRAAWVAPRSWPVEPVAIERAAADTLAAEWAARAGNRTEPACAAVDARSEAAEVEMAAVDPGTSGVVEAAGTAAAGIAAAVVADTAGIAAAAVVAVQLAAPQRFSQASRSALLYQRLWAARHLEALTLALYLPSWLAKVGSWVLEPPERRVARAKARADTALVAVPVVERNIVVGTEPSLAPAAEPASASVEGSGLEGQAAVGSQTADASDTLERTTCCCWAPSLR